MMIVSITINELHIHRISMWSWKEYIYYETMLIPIDACLIM